MEFENIRQMEMKDYISQKKKVSVQEMIEQFQVSDMTVRRDLSSLESLGYVKRIHGGAIYVKNEIDIPLSIRGDTGIPFKERIAERAQSLIKEGDFVILDAGSTTLEIARKLLARRQLTVITNSVDISYLLSDNPNIDVIMPGGDLRHSTHSLVGPVTVQFLRALKVDHAFIGCSGISLERGLMNSNMAEAEVKKVMMQVANQVTVVADYTKFSEITLLGFQPIDRVNTIITNAELADEIKGSFSDLKTEMIYV